MNNLGFAEDANVLTEKFPGAYNEWYTRIAVRAVLRNNEGKVALMHGGKYDFYKLPGGGVEQEEDLATAFVREVEEETGLIARAIGDIGVFVEKRDEERMFQISFCYLAEIADKGNLNLTEEEVNQKFRMIWVDIDEAIRLVVRNKRNHYDVNFMSARAEAVLRKAKELIKVQ